MDEVSGIEHNFIDAHGLGVQILATLASIFIFWEQQCLRL